MQYVFYVMEKSISYSISILAFLNDSSVAIITWILFVSETILNCFSAIHVLVNGKPKNVFFISYLRGQSEFKGTAPNYINEFMAKINRY
jgi:hypothetical protein